MSFSISIILSGKMPILYAIINDLTLLYHGFSFFASPFSYYIIPKNLQERGKKSFLGAKREGERPLKEKEGRADAVRPLAQWTKILPQKGWNFWPTKRISFCRMVKNKPYFPWENLVFHFFIDKN
ncbi:MAG: hypothetical protein J6W28_07675 [Clostridia bacterium]|nr:hypothetical protein [Clostridia bacterium]